MEIIKGKCEGVAHARWNTVTYQALWRTLHTPLPTLHGGDKQRWETGQVNRSVCSHAHKRTLSIEQPVFVVTCHSLP